MQYIGLRMYVCCYIIAKFNKLYHDAFDQDQ